MSNYFLPYPLPLRNPYSPFRGFSFTRPIHIRGGEKDLRDYQVRIVLNSNNFPLNKCKSDGSDIRFKDETGEALPYWIESWTPDEAVIWCRIPFIPANRIKDIWIIYGNPAARSASDGDATFDLFDAFEGTSVDGSKWTEHRQGSANAIVEVGGGALHLAGEPNVISSGNIRSIRRFKKNIVIEIKRKAINCGGSVVYMDISIGSGSIRDADDGGTSKWWHTTLGSGYLWKIQDATLAHTIKMPETGGKIVLTDDWVPTSDAISNYTIHSFVLSDEPSDNIRWYIRKNMFKNFERYENNPLSIPLYGANGVVHPDVLYFPNGIDGYKYWMVYTPYPPNEKEHPSIVRSNNGIDWVDTGISNPVISHSGWEHDADPDMIYVSDYSKWFMVWGPNTGSGHYEIAFAYSSDGKTWTEYDGDPVNGNTNPIIVSGEDNGAQSWEHDSGVSRIQYPTMFYKNGTFYLFYGSNKEGANRGKGGYVTFTWDDSTHSVKNLQRYSGNPVIDLPEDSEFKSGCGHLDISYYNGIYYMYAVREILGSLNYELCLITSTDLVNWVNQGKALGRGSSDWESKHIYRSSPATDAEGNLVLFSGKIKLYYSGYSSATGYPRIGLAYGTRDPVLRDKATDTDWLNNDKYILISQGEYSNGYGGDQYVDWIRVRKYTNSEPTVIV